MNTKNDVRVAQTATDEFAIHQFKDFAGSASSATLEWEGQSDIAPTTSTVYLQIYNYDTPAWENVHSNNTTEVSTDFILTGGIADLTNYKDDGNIITCRVYQEAV